MQNTIARLRAKKQDEGFTLIELLVVVVIIGVLVAIAVPVYLNYRQGAADKSAQSDVRGAISAIEQFYTNNGNAYPVGPRSNVAPATSIPLPALTGGTAGTITLSDKTLLGYNYTAGSLTYLICARNTGGSGKYYAYNSSSGGSVKVSTVATPSLTNC